VLVPVSNSADLECIFVVIYTYVGDNGGQKSRKPIVREVTLYEDFTIDSSVYDM